METKKDALWDARQAGAESALTEHLTPEFLATLAIAVRTCGWSVDAVESISFAEWCFDLAKITRPNLKPFDYDGEPPRE